MADYKDHLGNAEFVNYGIVISALVYEKTYSHIAETFEVSKPYISQILKRWNSDNNFNDKRINNGGSNKKMSKTKQESMVSLIEENRSSSLKDLARALEKEFDLTLSTQTISSALKSDGFIKSLPTKIPYLSTNAIDKTYR